MHGPVLRLALCQDEFEEVGNAALKGRKDGVKVMQEQLAASLEGHIFYRGMNDFQRSNKRNTSRGYI